MNGQLPIDYGTPAYEAVWMRLKLELPANASTSQLQGRMHVICAHAHGYERYIAAHKCDDKQGEIARQSVEIARLRKRLAESIDVEIGLLEGEVHQEYEYTEAQRSIAAQLAALRAERVGLS